MNASKEKIQYNVTAFWKHLEASSKVKPLNEYTYADQYQVIETACVELESLERVWKAVCKLLHKEVIVSLKPCFLKERERLKKAIIYMSNRIQAADDLVKKLESEGTLVSTGSFRLNDEP